MERIHARKANPVAQLLLLTPQDAAHALPALEFLPHRVRQAPLDAAAVLPGDEAVLIDARQDFAAARAACRLLAASGLPVLAIVTEGGLSALSAEWGLSDLLLPGAGPAEIDARLRLALARRPAAASSTLRASGIVVDEDNYTARSGERALDLTFKEFELLRFFLGHPGRVFTREQILSEVWGYDYFGGTRTVDVHIRRLRAKLGEADQLIGTVRNVGYRFAPTEEDSHAPARDH